jgi:gamma-glutamyltranspeptidase/glutathione hydrolase
LFAPRGERILAGLVRRVRIAASTVSALGAAVFAILAAPLGCGPPPPASAPRIVANVAPPAKATAPSEPSKPAIKRHRFAVATENAEASRAAMDVLEKGGSAVDGAIAAALVLGVAEPVSSGIGGGGFALVYDAKKKTTTAFDFREVAPIGLHVQDLATRPPAENKRGSTVGIPGEVAGLAELHARFGKLAFADDARAAIDLAEHGFTVSPHLARALGWFDAWLRKTPRYRLFVKESGVAGSKDVVKNPALAATLRRLAAEGKAAFYEGAIAKDVVETARAAGSAMTEGELKAYKLVERKPLAIAWEGYEVETMPPPSAGGLYVLETLRMHKKSELLALEFGSGAYDHLIAETIRGAVADRIRAVGDPAFVRTDVEALASPARMKARRAKISLTSTTPVEKFSIAENGTSHLCIVDDEGNVVSMTTTINNPFGARLPTSGGFLLNDELDDFTTETIEKKFGQPNLPNKPHGGARPVSSMTPTIVFENGEPIFALGGSGGMRIASGVPQVLLAHLVFGHSAAQSVADPRIEAPATGGLILDVSPPELVLDLKKRGEVVETTKVNFSGIQAIAINRKNGERELEAGADPRKGGSALVE